MPRPLTPEQDVPLLQDFVDQMKSLLGAIVQRPYHIVPGRHHELLRAAWNEVAPQFGRLEAELKTQANARRLEQVGLVGFRLRFELEVFAHHRAELLDHAPELFAAPESFPLQEPRPEARKPRFFAKLRRLLGRCLKAGNVILGSLSSVFPAAEIISQFKEGVEEGITLARSERNR